MSIRRRLEQLELGEDDKLLIYQQPGIIWGFSRGPYHATCVYYVVINDDRHADGMRQACGSDKRESFYGGRSPVKISCNFIITM